MQLAQPVSEGLGGNQRSFPRRTSKLGEDYLVSPNQGFDVPEFDRSRQNVDTRQADPPPLLVRIDKALRFRGYREAVKHHSPGSAQPRHPTYGSRCLLSNPERILQCSSVCATLSGSMPAIGSNLVGVRNSTGAKRRYFTAFSASLRGMDFSERRILTGGAVERVRDGCSAFFAVLTDVHRPGDLGGERHRVFRFPPVSDNASARSCLVRLSARRTRSMA
jgi:hypothetical protein